MKLMLNLRDSLILINIIMLHRILNSKKDIDGTDEKTHATGQSKCISRSLSTAGQTLISSVQIYMIFSPAILMLG